MSEHRTLLQSQFRYSMVPDWVTDHEQLSDGAVRCYSTLARYANSDHEVWPGQATIAKRMRRSERAVRGYFKELEAVGALVQVKRRFDSTTIYVLMQVCPISTDRPAEFCRSASEPFSDRQNSAAQTGRILPPNESQERERDNPVVPKGTQEELSTDRVSWPEGVTRTVAQTVVCPDCGSGVDQLCRSKAGKARPRPHRARGLVAHAIATEHLVLPSGPLTPEPPCPDCSGSRWVLCADDPNQAQPCKCANAELVP